MLARARRDLSAIRHPQCAYAGGDRHARGRAHRFRIPAPARHGRGAARILSRPPQGRAARASMRRSAAMRICWPIWCAACWRTARTRRSSTASPTTKRRSTTSSPIPSTQLGQDVAAAQSPHPAAGRYAAAAAGTPPVSSGPIRPAASRCSPAMRTALQTLPTAGPIVSRQRERPRIPRRASIRPTARG